MKKTLHILYACLAAIGLLASCSQPFAGSGESKAGSGPGTLCLFPAAGTPSGRSIGPASLASEITSYHVILRKATVPVFEQDVEPGASATVSSLETGDYTVIAYGYNASSQPIAFGSSDIVVVSGSQTKPITLYNYRNPDLSGTGSFSLTLAVANLPVDQSALTVKLIRESDKTEVNLSSALSLTKGAEAGSCTLHISQMTLPSGDYRFLVSYSYAGMTYYLIRDPVVKIFDNRLSAPSGDLSYNALTPMTGARVAFDGTVLVDGVSMQTTYAGRKLFYGVYDAESGSMLGIGLMVLDGTASGSSAPVDPITRAPMFITPGTVYTVSAMCDMGDASHMDGFYSSITDLGSIVNIGEIVPHYGDYVTQANKQGQIPFVAATGTTAVTLDPTEFGLNTSNTYFVSGTASGDMTGSLVANACTLPQAIGFANMASTTNPDSYATIYVCGDLTLTDSLSLNCKISIEGLDKTTPPVISLSGIPAASFINLNTGSGLRLSSLTLDGTAASGMMSGAITVGRDAYLETDTGTTIRNMAPSTLTAVYGGAVCLSGGTLSMYGTTISGCAATLGGAVYVGSYVDGSTIPGNLTVGGGCVITGNSATDGGGIYIADSCLMYLEPSEPRAKIYGNSASNEGGGVFLNTGALSDPALILTDATSPVAYSNTSGVAGKENFASYGNYNTYGIFYVTQSGTGDGLTPANPDSFADQIVNGNATSIVLLEDIVYSQQMSIDRQLDIRSADGQFSISTGATITGAYIKLSSLAVLNLDSVIIGPETAGSCNADGLVEVGAGCQFYMNNGSVLRNNVNSSNDTVNKHGGAVRVLAGGLFKMNDGSNARITGCPSVNGCGGGVYLTGTSSLPAAFYLYSGEVSGNTALDAGGGVYAGSYGAVLIRNATVSNNTVGGSGGGIYCQAYSSLDLNTGAYGVTGNKAGVCGGVYMQLGSVVSDDTAGSGISGNYLSDGTTASDFVTNGS